MNWQYANALQRSIVRQVDENTTESILMSELPAGDTIDPWTGAGPDIAPVNAKQLRQALTRTGFRAQVDDAVAAGNQDLKDWYEFETQFTRSDPQVKVMATVLGQSDDQVDDLWRLAKSL